MAHANPHQAALRDVGGIAIRLLDDAYSTWVQAQVECHEALRAWLDADTGNQLAFYVYRAALDREEAAAIDLERLSHLVAA
jgi:hypothetical protein